MQQIEKSRSQVFAVVPEVIDISMPLGFVRTETYLVGVSVDDGRARIRECRRTAKPWQSSVDLSWVPNDLTIPPKKPVVLSAKVSDPESATRPLEDVAFTSVERAYFKVKVPLGTTIIPPEKDLDVDHYTELSLPGDCVVVFQVLDDKDISNDVVDRMVDTAKNKMSEPEFRRLTSSMAFMDQEK